MKRVQPDLEIIQEKLPDTGDGVLTRHKLGRGIVEFSYISQNKEDIPKKTKHGETRSRSKNIFLFDVDFYSVLREAHGNSLRDSIIADLLANPHRLSHELQKILSEAKWKRVQDYLIYLDSVADASGKRAAFLAALWVDHFEDKLTERWLAAMAHYQYLVRRNIFAFGYLVALIDQQANEGHFLRGKKSVEGARQGGFERQRALKADIDKTLLEMKRLIAGAGKHTVTRAAQLAYANGLGTSVEANRKLFRRHQKK